MLLQGSSTLMCGGGIFWGVAKVGRVGKYKGMPWCFFGDDIGKGGRHMETAAWKIMGNGRI